MVDLVKKERTTLLVEVECLLEHDMWGGCNIRISNRWIVAPVYCNSIEIFNFRKGRQGLKWFEELGLQKCRMQLFFVQGITWMNMGR